MIARYREIATEYEDIVHRPAMLRKNMTATDQPSAAIRREDAERAPELERSEFSEVQYDEAYPDGIEQHFWHLARNRLVEASLRQDLDQQSRVLEIGCGPGIVLQHLRGRGLDCWGCELGDPPLPDQIRPFVFVKRDFRDLNPAFRREVSSVLLLDVLEHIADDAGFLRALAAAFPQSRSLVLTVPARSELWSNYDEHYGHFRRYDRASLAAVLDDGGFVVVRQRYFFQELYLPMLLTAKLAGRRRTEFQKPANPRLHRSIGRLSGVCAGTLPGNWPGTSLIARAVRR